MKSSVCFLLLFFTSFFLFPDNIRGPLQEYVRVAGNSEFSEEFRIKLEDLFAVDIPEEKQEYLQGIELEIKIPSSVKKYRNSFALFLYSNCSPGPDADSVGGSMRRYSGSQLGFEIIPSRTIIYYRLMKESEENLQHSPDTVLVKKPFSIPSLPVIGTILPVMKGIPSIVTESNFRIRVRGIFEETGDLVLKPVGFTGEIPADDVLLSIDGKNILFTEEKITLSAGLHTLTLLSGTFKSQNLTFGIESDKSTVLEIPFEKLVPLVYIEGPMDTEIFLDGNLIDYHEGSGIELSEGDHTILFTIGDYRVSKQFSVEKGKEYYISLFMDVIIEER